MTSIWYVIAAAALTVIVLRRDLRRQMLVAMPFYQGGC